MRTASPNSLPPGMATTLPVQGTLHVKAPHLIWLSVSPKEQVRLVLKFWGEA